MDIEEQISRLPVVKLYNMKVVDVTDKNLSIYLNLAQCYEAEFSVLTKKKPNKDGLFALDTDIISPTRGYIVFIEKTPAGIAAIGCKGTSYEVFEFYIVPYFRKEKLGTKFAHSIWSKFPGKWEVKQIEGADHAVNFWRNCIRKYPHKNYIEDQYQDHYWGQVNRQSFIVF
ncbi:GNAT family N-acetyltransferase [Microbulbifer variabilis]|uniref:GNAT family N-acetyltransferase n=1 Tax=Microbulbifer variabilis TaxID=266805 RepID=UPI001CFEC60E|nr:GNAT family N-acetyltransferase [Microbulbifer variabilis]